MFQPGPEGCWGASCPHRAPNGTQTAPGAKTLLAKAPHSPVGFGDFPSLHSILGIPTWNGAKLSTFLTLCRGGKMSRQLSQHQDSVPSPCSHCHPPTVTAPASPWPLLLCLPEAAVCEPRLVATGTKATVSMATASLCRLWR